MREIEDKDGVTLQSPYIQKNFCEFVGKERGGFIAHYEVGKMGVNNDGGKIHKKREI